MTPPTCTQTDPSHKMASWVAVKSEQLFRAIFEQAAVGIALIETTTGRFIRINQQYLDMMGFSLAEVMATTFMAITYPDDPPADLDRMEELKSGCIRSFSMEKRLFRSDGSLVWVDLTVAPLWEVGEQPSFHIAVVQDITERKQAEQHLSNLNATLEQQVAQRTSELEESRQQLQAIVDGTSDAVFLKDSEGRYLVCNAAACRFVGKPPHEVLGQDDRALFPFQDAQGLIEGDRQIMTSGVTKIYEETVTTAGGIQRTFLTAKGPVFNSQNRVTGLFGIARDITERKQAEETLRRLNETLEQRVAERTEALRVSENFRKEVLDSLSAHVAVLDVSGVIVAVNQVWEKAALLNDPSGLARVSTGANYLNVCERAGDKSAEVRQTLAGILDVLTGRKQVFESEYRCVRPEGQRQWFSMRVTPLSSRRGCVIAHEDVTERKRAEEALRDSYQRLQVLSREVQVAKEGERSRLSRELHDEFGQVLTGLKFDLTDVVGTLGKNSGGSGTAVCQKAMRALSMVDRLFTSLRGMVSDLRSPLLEELGLVPALESLAMNAQDLTGMRCQVMVDRAACRASGGIEVEGAVYRMAQELLTNVVRHAKATTVTVTLGCTGGCVTLTIEDNGQGFDTRHVRKTNQFGLRGIRERAELLGGKVEIDSKLRVGTVVRIQIPLKLPTSRRGLVVPAQGLKRTTTRRRRRGGK